MREYIQAVRAIWAAWKGDGKLSYEGKHENLSFHALRRQYASRQPLVQCAELAPECWHWCRSLRIAGGPDFEMICCPEDVHCRQQPGQHEHVVCEGCAVPICTECRVRLLSEQDCRVPMALANANWAGNVRELIYRWHMRWIELAAASLLWTTIIVYYLEQ